MNMNQDTLTALQAFAPRHTFFEQEPTISLAEASLLEPSTPDSMRSESVDPQSQGSSSDKKPVKKRKSWGQELPIPKTNLPPRKRAKTEDEKEQRRIERVLRNRAAAQSSRERKRQEVERLEGEKHNIEYHSHCLKQRLLAVEHEKFLLMQEVVKLRTALGHPNPTAAVAMPHQQTAPPPPPPQPRQMPAYLKPVKQEIPEGAFGIHTPVSARSPEPSACASVAPSCLSRSPSPAPSTEFYGDALALDLTQHPAVSVPGHHQRARPSISIDERPLSRRSSVSVALTTASTCDSAHPNSAGEGRFGRLLASPEAAEPHVSFFEDGLGASEAGAFAFDALVDVDADLGGKAGGPSFMAFGDQHEADHFDFLTSGAVGDAAITSDASSQQHAAQVPV